MKTISPRTRRFIMAGVLGLLAISPLFAEPAFPARVHVVEDYETDIEKRWWLRGKIELENVPPSRSASVPNKRACRATASKNFDRKQGDQSVTWKAVIFNPVPGPPMGPRTRLRFRYWLSGTNSLRVQIYSLSKGYHRFLTLRDLPEKKWQQATVDMTAARRPDGSGGPLAADERIDDIQFYIDQAGELLIDDIVLYDAATKDETRTFPARTIFTGWFDTGKQGAEWPGDFEIVLHEKPRTWDAAKSVPAGKNGAHTLRVNMRGSRSLSKITKLTFQYKLAKKEGPIGVALADSSGITLARHTVQTKTLGQWSTGTLSFTFKKPVLASEIVFTPPPGAELWVDDVLLFEE